MNSFHASRGTQLQPGLDTEHMGTYWRENSDQKMSGRMHNAKQTGTCPEAACQRITIEWCAREARQSFNANSSEVASGIRTTSISLGGRISLPLLPGVEPTMADGRGCPPIRHAGSGRYQRHEPGHQNAAMPCHASKSSYGITETFGKCPLHAL